MKLNSVLYNKLLLQAEEAKSQGMHKLASGIFQSIGSYPEDDTKEYSYENMNEEIYNDLWKAAAKLLAYYDLKSVQAEKIDEIIQIYSNKLINELENSLELGSIIKGPFEPKVLGENK